MAEIEALTEQLWAEWHARDLSDPDWELTWTDRFRAAVPDPETQILMDGAVMEKSSLPWGIPVYRFGRADDAFGMVWWAEKPDTTGLDEFGALWVYLLDPAAVLASCMTEGTRTWIVDQGLVWPQEVSRV